MFYSPVFEKIGGPFRREKSKRYAKYIKRRNFTKNAKFKKSTPLFYNKNVERYRQKRQEGKFKRKRKNSDFGNFSDNKRSSRKEYFQ